MSLTGGKIELQQLHQSRRKQERQILCYSRLAQRCQPAEALALQSECACQGARNVEPVEGRLLLQEDLKLVGSKPHQQLPALLLAVWLGS